MAGGIGGGGIIVPINVLFFGCSFTHAVALSKIGIFAGSLIRFLSEIHHRSPHKYEDRPLIEYQTACLFEPFILAGTVIGVILNIWMPEYILLILLIVTLVWNTAKLYQKTVQLYNVETRKDLQNININIEMNTGDNKDND